MRKQRQQPADDRDIFEKALDSGWVGPGALVTGALVGGALGRRSLRKVWAGKEDLIPLSDRITVPAVSAAYGALHGGGLGAMIEEARREEVRRELRKNKKRK